MRRTQVLFIGMFLIAFHSIALAEGAIATGKLMPRQWFGVAINKSTLQQARSDALAVCNQSGPNCSVLTTFRNACVAVTWGETRGRAGYAATTRQTIDDARNAATSYCYSQGMSRCEIRYAACDTVDEAASARQKRLQEQFAADEAERRRREAESAAQAAQQRERESRQAEADARTRARDLTQRERFTEGPSPPRENSLQISNKKALSLALLLIIGIFIVILKQGYPQLAGWTAVIVPAASLILYTMFGFELKDQVTLAEWPLFAPIFGGVIVAAIAWKLHA